MLTVGKHGAGKPGRGIDKMSDRKGGCGSYVSHSHVLDMWFSLVPDSLRA